MSNLNTPVNAFPIGNQLYKLSQRTGRPKKFTTPDDLWNAAVNYFDWVVENPLVEYKVHGTPPRIVSLNKMRPMTLQGLCLHLGICNLRYYQRNADYSRIVSRIYSTIYVYNLEGAMVGLFNPCIMWRLLGTMDLGLNKNLP